eukprot:GEMP01107380.1.p1 GENE.GEMP01107380.1~~GEMP01107380.1.p1  ORF type:complete len:142 (+),score=37.65 GEMP01107380.1:39-464(+)
MEIFEGVTFYANYRGPPVDAPKRTATSSFEASPQNRIHPSIQAAQQVLEDAVKDGIGGSTANAIHRAKLSIQQMRLANAEILVIDTTLEDRDFRETVEENDRLIEVYLEGIRQLEDDDSIPSCSDNMVNAALICGHDTALA